VRDFPLARADKCVVIQSNAKQLGAIMGRDKSRRIGLPSGGARRFADELFEFTPGNSNQNALLGALQFSAQSIPRQQNPANGKGIIKHRILWRGWANFFLRPRLEHQRSQCQREQCREEPAVEANR
jgi:hypothetical protein